MVNVQRAWKPPPIGHVKIHVDGGLSHDGTVGVVAAICRNEQGRYLESSAIILPGVYNPTTLEAIACREALALAADLSLDHLVIVCDCGPIVDDVKKEFGGAHITIVKE